jgi:hypothetical protein
MRYKSALMTLALFAGATNLSHAGLEVGLGAEHFDWKEFDNSGSQILKEFGPRLTLSFNLTQDKKDDKGLLFAYRGKLYGGKVTYDGATFAGTPLVTDTKYTGMSHEGQAIFRYDYERGKLDYVIGLGWDSWRRAIRNDALSLDQLEDYNIYYLRLGLNYDHPGKPGMHGGAGIKHTLYTTEDAHLTDLGYSPNPTINPGKSLSAYAELGYRLSNTKWDLVGYYDSYDFSASDPITTQRPPGTDVQLYQPKSEMKLLGFKAMYRF